MNRDVELIVKINNEQVEAVNIDFYSTKTSQFLTLKVLSGNVFSDADIVELAYREDDFIVKFATLIISKIVDTKRGILEIFCRNVFWKEERAYIKAASWRKATIKDIVNDLFVNANIVDFDLSKLPDITLERFSYENSVFINILNNLIKAVKFSTDIDLEYDYSIEGAFYLGELGGLEKDLGYSLEFTDADIIKISKNRIKLHLLPLLLNQLVKINSEEFQVISSRIYINKQSSSTIIRVK